MRMRTTPKASVTSVLLYGERDCVAWTGSCARACRPCRHRDFLERKLRVTWSLRRNSDKALPASHTIEILFTVPADFTEGGISNVPGVLMKQSEQARGVPLAGLAVKVTNGHFLIGLSAVNSDQRRNIQLLKERDWFDVPVVYTSGKRAIVAMEKGTPGARAFEEAFRVWRE